MTHSGMRTPQGPVITRPAQAGCRREGSPFSPVSDGGPPTPSTLHQVCRTHPPTPYQGLHSLRGTKNLFSDLCITVLIWKWLVSGDSLVVNIVATGPQSTGMTLQCDPDIPFLFWPPFCDLRDSPLLCPCPMSQWYLGQYKTSRYFRNGSMTSTWTASLSQCRTHADRNRKASFSTLCPWSALDGASVWLIPIMAVSSPLLHWQGLHYALSQLVPESLIFLKRWWIPRLPQKAKRPS